MKIRKKTAKAIFLLILSVVMLMPVVVGATETAQLEPRFTGIEEQVALLSINSAGKASCGCSVLATTGYTLETTMALECDGSAIKTWTGSGTLVQLDKIYYVTSGFDYQVVVTSKVKTSGGLYLYTYTVESPVESY